MNLFRIYRKFLGVAGLDRLLTGSGQEFQNDIFVILDRLFYIADVNIFVRLVGELRVAGSLQPQSGSRTVEYQRQYNRGNDQWYQCSESHDPFPAIAPMAVPGD